MPNWCQFEMRVKGNVEDINGAYKQIFACDYGDEGKHLHRVHTEMANFLIEENGIGIIHGECAWSVKVCMFDDEQSYYRTEVNKIPNYQGTTIDRISEEFNLDIEIRSEETMMGFVEEFYISKGNIEHDICLEIPPRFIFSNLV